LGSFAYAQDDTQYRIPRFGMTGREIAMQAVETL